MLPHLTSNVGVVSLVLSSLFDGPVSLVDWRFGVKIGLVGTVVSKVIERV